MKQRDYEMVKDTKVDSRNKSERERERERFDVLMMAKDVLLLFG